MQYKKSDLIRILRTVPRQGWTWQKIKDMVDSLWRDPVQLRWSGFETAGGTDCVISWAVNTFTITPLDPDAEGPILPSFAFYQFRRMITYHVKGAAESITVDPLLEGRYIFYYDFSETNPGFQELKYLHNPTEVQQKDLLQFATIIAFIYWDAAAGEALHFGDDRHGSEWQPQMHLYLHNAFGARRKSGLQFTGYSLNNDGSSNDHAQFNITGGVMLHDDFELQIPGSSTSIPILYSFGTLPRFLANAGYAFAGATRVYYNSGQISLAQADSGNFVLYHIFAINEILTESRKIISVMGTAQYTTLADAYKGVDPELDGIVTYMPQRGRCYLGSIIIQTSDDFANDTKARIVALTGNESHPPVTIAENSKELLSLDDKQELSIPGEFETDEFYGIKNRVWQKITGGGGTDGRGIVSIILTSTIGLTKTYTITYTDATTSTFTVQDGADGVDGTNGTNGTDGNDGAPGAPGANGTNGRGITSIVLHATVGLVKTYRITYTDATTFDFDVTDGEDGSGGTGGSEPPELHLDFEEAGDEFVYNVPYNMKFTSQSSEAGDATLDIALDTNMPRFTKLTITATAAGLVSLYGVLI